MPQNFGTSTRNMMMPIVSMSTDSYKGTWGGVRGAVRPHLATAPTLDMDLVDKQLQSSYRDLVAFTLRLPTADVINMGDMPPTVTISSC